MGDQELVRIARALGDPTRLHMLRVIAAGGRVTCGAISRRVAVRPATVSHHLRVLGEAGLVEARRDGQYIEVRARHSRIDEFRAALRTLRRAASSQSPATHGRARKATA